MEIWLAKLPKIQPLFFLKHQVKSIPDNDLASGNRSLAMVFLLFEVGINFLQFKRLHTTFNLRPNEHDIGLIDSVVTMEDLFVRMEGK